MIIASVVGGGTCFTEAEVDAAGWILLGGGGRSGWAEMSWSAGDLLANDVTTLPNEKL